MKLAKKLGGLVRVLDAIPLGVTVQTPRGSLMYANNQILQRLKVKSLAELRNSIKNGFLENIVVKDEDGEVVPVSQFPGRLATLTKTPQKKLVHYKIHGSDEFVWSLIQSSPIFGDKGELIAVINLIDDYSAIKKSYDSLKIINNIANYISSTTSFKERLERFAESVVPLFSDWCTIDILEKGKIIRAAEAHVDNTKIPKTLKREKQHLADLIRPNAIAEVIKTGKALFIPDVSNKILEYGNNKDLTDARILRLQSVVIIPIKARGRNIGAITFVWSESGRRYSVSDFSLLKTLSEEVSILADNARLFNTTEKSLTREKELTKKLYESQQTLNLALDAGKMSVWDWDIKADRINWTANTETNFGLEIGNFKGSLNKFSEQINNNDKAVFLHEIESSLKKLNNVSVNFRVYSKKTKLRWIRMEGLLLLDSKGKPERMVGVWSDITESKNAQDKLTESEKKFRLAVSSAMDSILLYENKTNEIVDINTSSSVMFNKPRNKIIGRKLNQLLSDLPQGERGETETKDGSKTLEYAKTVNFMNNLNLLFIRDITERKIEEKRREHFLGIVSHELKNPLVSINAHTENIKRLIKNHPDEGVLRYLNKINDSSEMLNRLINDLLDVTRIRQQRLLFSYEFFDLDSLLKDAVKVNKFHSNSHQIIYNGTEPMEIMADKTRITQVVVNLLENAIKYSPEASRVEISAYKNKRYVSVTVKDYGKGISRNERKKIFELYRRGGGEGNIEGLGVGLYISNEIIKQHGGRFKVKSKVGKGSEFTFILPTTPKLKRKKVKG